MRTKEEILQNQKHGFNSGQKESALNAMQQYADEFACAFAEWIAQNANNYLESDKSINMNEFEYLKDNEESIIVTTTELLEIFKQQINGKV